MKGLCMQCAIKLQGSDDKDFVTPPFAKRRMVQCKGCGFTVVNSKGECISECCKTHGSK